ncbi:MAG: hypothetical protein Q8S11_11200 [Daejeonella sp.]|uniref:hypothetical protein n=1 Tax=Daejeonella sp. TaxID=2805397 RepID=UPI0027339E50|nr:hypothetical protein [Daejeonella sp.]MDP3468893.1 hypothetical protein [Daejeonella sp.]
MTWKNYIGILGSLLVIAGGMMPMLHIPIIGNWNYWDLDTVLASIVYSLAILSLIAASGNKRGLLRFCGLTLLLVLTFTFGAVFFKVSNYFNFIPLKKLAAVAGRMIQYRWIGWALIASGAILMILFSGRNKKPQIH